MRLSAHLMAASAALASVGCLDTTSPPRERLGFVSVTSYDAGGGQHALRAEGAFYHVSGLSIGFPTEETCVSAAYSTAEPPPTNLPTLNAGPALEFRVSGLTDSLFRLTAFGVVTYSTDAEATPFTPGDTLTLDVPGAIDGFPAGSLQLRTADPFTFGTVGNPTPGEALAVTWTPSPASGSFMTLSLRYASSPSVAEPDRQIFCSFVDDGSGQVTASLAEFWGTSPQATRSVASARVRMDVVSLDQRTLLAVVSSFDQPLLPAAGASMARGLRP